MYMEIKLRNGIYYGAIRKESDTYESQVALNG